MDTLEYSLKKNKSFVHRYFSKIHTLRASDAFLLKYAFLICCIFLILTLIKFSVQNTVHVATIGGTYTEGILGTPRFINPVLAGTRADKDLTALIYEGLMTLGKEGVLVPNIADSITISEDGLTYNIILKQNITFHDGTPLTAHDVIFTLNRIQDPMLASPLRANFDGIHTEEIGTHEINFVLPEPYAPFIENLTFGILPEHIWKDVSTEEFPFSQYNNEPIGTGSYKVHKITRNISGIPELYELSAYMQHHDETPKIQTIKLHFFPTEEKIQKAFTEGIIEGVAGVDPSHIIDYKISENTHHIERIPQPRTFGIFFNQNKNTALRDISARKALNEAIHRDDLVKQILLGYGNVLNSPIPHGFSTLIPSTTTTGNIDTARDILKNGSWKYNLEEKVWQKKIEGSTTTLSFTISTVNDKTFEAVAEFLRASWEQLGVPVTIKQFEQTDLTQAIIRPRDYEALFFGTQLGRPLDYYSFWHSSQRNDPGLNIALYANITTDSILSELRKNTDTHLHTEALTKFAQEIEKEIPALFLYTPELLYVFPNKIYNAQFTGVSEPHERFAGIHHWYIETDSVWSFLTK